LKEARILGGFYLIGRGKSRLQNFKNTDFSKKLNISIPRPLELRNPGNPSEQNKGSVGFPVS
jgi:hypothetical protein